MYSHATPPCAATSPTIDARLLFSRSGLSYHSFSLSFYRSYPSFSRSYVSFSRCSPPFSRSYPPFCHSYLSFNSFRLPFYRSYAPFYHSLVSFNGSYAPFHCPYYTQRRRWRKCATARQSGTTLSGSGIAGSTPSVRAIVSVLRSTMNSTHSGKWSETR